MILSSEWFQASAGQCWRKVGEMREARSQDTQPCVEAPV